MDCCGGCKVKLLQVYVGNIEVETIWQVSLEEFGHSQKMSQNVKKIHSSACSERFRHSEIYLIAARINMQWT